MRKRKTKNLDRLETNGQEKARTTANSGRKNSSSKSRKASSQPRRRRNEQASGAKKRQNDIHRQAFKLADFLTDEEIKRLKAIK